MMSELDFFLLKHRIFLVKHFYQFNGDSVCVKTKYETNYKNCNESPKFSCDVLVEIINLFEQTGSVFKSPEKTLETSYQQIEQIYVKEEDADERSEDDVEELDFLKSPLPPESLQVNPFNNSDSDIFNSSQDSISDADTLSNEEFPLIQGFKNKREGEVNNLPDWWDNSDDSLQATDLDWCESRPDQEGEFHINPNSDNFQFKCSYSNCQKAFKSLIALKLHRISHPVRDRDKIYKCQKCNKIFLRKYAIKRHYKLKHLPLRYKCQKCGCSFREDKNYRNHLEDHHGEEDVDFFDEPPPPSPVFKPPVRKKELEDEEESVVSELNSREEVKPGKKVRKKRPEKFKTCEVCGKICSTARYRKHTMTHTGERPIKCKICGKGFIYSSGYHTHMQVQHKGMKANVKRAMCEICGKKVTGEKVLEAHIKKIHERPEQEFKCKVSGCGKSYPNEKFLRRHMDRHSGKMFKCTFCDMQYKDKSQLKIHIDKVHLKTEPSWKCELCGKGSWHIKDHRTHMQKLHQIEVPFLRKKIT